MRAIRVNTAVRWWLIPAAMAVGGLTVQQAHSQATTQATQASGSPSTAAAAKSKATRGNYRAMRASELMGQDVRGAKGEDVGEIQDLVVNIDTGQVRYAVMSFDPGILSGERLVPVPVKELRMSKDGDELVYSVNREQVERTAMNRGDLDNRLLADATRMGEIDKAWGLDLGSANTPKTRGQATAQGRSLRLASTLVGKPVSGRAGQPVGELEELVIDMRAQKVHYAVLALEPGWVGMEKKVLLPLDSLQPQSGSDALALHADKARLQAMPAFEEKSYANLNEPGFRGRVDRWISAAREPGAQGQARRAASAAGTDTRASGAPAAAGASGTPGESRR